jgi:cobalt-zinc-cadmium efflux system outer membrane protein
VSQRISDFFYRSKLSGAGTSDLEAAKLDAAGAVVELAFEVRLAFFRHQANEQRAELWRTVLLAEEARYEAAKALHEAGNITDLAFFSERDLYERAKIGVTDAELAATNSREELSAALGLSGEKATWKISPRLPDPPAEAPVLEDFEQRAVELSLELVALEHRIAAVRDRLTVAEWTGAVPLLELGVVAHREDPEAGWEIGPRLELALPIFDQQRGAVALEEANLERLENERAAREIEVRTGARRAAATVRAQHRRAIHYKEVILPLRARILEETLAAVNAMTAGVFQLLQAQREQIAAGLEYVSALEGYWTGQAGATQIASGRMKRSMGSMGEAIDAVPSGPARGDH